MNLRKLLRSLVREEGGWAVVTAVSMMTIMLGMGLATLSLVDSEQRETRRERQGEARFNLTETVLTNQAFQLARQWPMATATGAPPATPYPASCTGSLGGTAPTDARCPDPTKLAQAFTSVDYSGGATWTTTVRDNGGGAEQFYEETIVNAQPRYDANNDNRMWILAEATVRQRTRRIVALVRADVQPVTFPTRTVVAGFLGTSNSGNKTIIDTDGVPGAGSAAQPGAVSLRCQASSSTCLTVADPSKQQISPPIIDYGYPQTPVLDEATVALLEQQARASGTYTASGCPASLTGAVVFIENGDCSYGANGAGNTPTVPGIVVVRRGTLTFGGTYTFYGIVYALNAQSSSSNVVSIGGTAGINGAVFVDGNGGVLAGSSKANVVFDPRVFGNSRVVGDGMIVRNTWRELPSTATPAP